MSSLMKAQQGVQEGVITTIAGIAASSVLIVQMILLVLPLLHELVYMFYSARQSVSDYFDMQSKLITMNAEKIKTTSAKSDEEKDKIYKKQMKTAELFRKISNIVSIKFSKGETKANEMIKNDDKPNYKIDDVTDTQPDSYSEIF